MSQPIERQRKRRRFPLSWLFVLTLVAALGGLLFRWWNTEATIPLSVAIAEFNALAKTDDVGKQEPPLTEAGVVAAIEAQLPSLRAGVISNTYRRIARTRTLPTTARLYSMTSFQRANGQMEIVWWVNLDIRTSQESGYGLRVRESNDPVSVQSDPDPTGAPL